MHNFKQPDGKIHPAVYCFKMAFHWKENPAFCLHNIERCINFGEEMMNAM